MPYCPKCDMEFVEGIKVCSDCGGPLVESKEVADAMKKKEQEEQLAAMAQEMDPFSGEGTDTEFSGDNPPEKSSPAHEFLRIRLLLSRRGTCHRRGTLPSGNFPSPNGRIPEIYV